MAAPKKTLIALALTAAGLGWLSVAPPDLLRVGANYSAKIVCSNVFIAQRDPADIIREDLQAPGNPILNLLKISVDREQQLVHSNFFGFIGKGLAVYRPGTGCAAVPDGDLASARQYVAHRPDIPAPKADQAWPNGSAAQPVPAVQTLIEQSDLHGPHARAVVVIHNGQLIAQHYAKGFSETTPLLGWSMTKSVTAALIGMQIADGKLALKQAGFWPVDTTKASTVTAATNANNPPGREAITLADMLAMQDGLDFNEGYGSVSDVTRMLYLEPDMAAFMKARPLAHPPGTHWNYSSGTTTLMSSLWQQAAGDKALDIPYQRLFAPLGMHSAIMEADARGTLVGSSYLYATAQDWARFGQFLLQDGVWNGKRLLPDGYVSYISTATEPSKGQYAKGQLWRWGPGRDTDDGKSPDLPFNLPADTYWMSGHDGQTVAIVPSKKLVMVRLGLTPAKLNYQPQAMLAEVIKHLPAQ